MSNLALEVKKETEIRIYQSASPVISVYEHTWNTYKDIRLFVEEDLSPYLNRFDITYQFGKLAEKTNLTMKEAFAAYQTIISHIQSAQKIVKEKGLTFPSLETEEVTRRFDDLQNLLNTYCKEWNYDTKHFSSLVSFRAKSSDCFYFSLSFNNQRCINVFVDEKISNFFTIKLDLSPYYFARESETLFYTLQELFEVTEVEKFYHMHSHTFYGIEEFDTFLQTFSNKTKEIGEEVTDETN